MLNAKVGRSANRVIAWSVRETVAKAVVGMMVVEESAKIIAVAEGAAIRPHVDVNHAFRNVETGAVGMMVVEESAKIIAVAEGAAIRPHVDVNHAFRNAETGAVAMMDAEDSVAMTAALKERPATRSHANARSANSVNPRVESAATTAAEGIWGPVAVKRASTVVAPMWRRLIVWRGNAVRMAWVGFVVCVQWVGPAMLHHYASLAIPAVKGYHEGACVRTGMWFFARMEKENGPRSVPGAYAMSNLAVGVRSVRSFNAFRIAWGRTAGTTGVVVLAVTAEWTNDVMQHHRCVCPGLAAVA
jgi:hypothetical protein